MTEVAGSVEHPESHVSTAAGQMHHRLPQGALVALRAGPALILLILTACWRVSAP
jgi:hypothetical protein